MLVDAIAAIATAFQTTQMVVSSYLSDLTDEEIRMEPATGCHPIAWQLGHLIASERDLLESICPGKGMTLPDGFAEQHNKQALENSTAQYLNKQAYVDLLEQSGQTFLTALQALSAEDLDQPSPEHFRQMFPTVGHICILIASHRLMHAGQWVPLRRKLNKPVVI